MNEVLYYCVRYHVFNIYNVVFFEDLVECIKWILEMKENLNNQFQIVSIYEF